MTNPIDKQPGLLLKSICLDRIAFSDAFLIALFDHPTNTPLAERIKQFGQINPLLVQQLGNGQYELLAGYPVYRILGELGVEQALCRVLPQSLAPILNFSLRIVHDAETLAISPILQAYLLRQAKQMVSAEEMLSLLSLMGHKPHQHKLKELDSLLELAPAAISAVHRGILAIKACKQIAFLTQQDQCSLIRLLELFRPGGSKQQKLIEMLVELVVREKKSLQTISNDCLPGDEESFRENAPQRLQSLLHHLHAQCYPLSTAAKDRFKKFVQQLQPPQGVTITHALAFEDETLTVGITFPDAASLQKQWPAIKKTLAQALRAG